MRLILGSLLVFLMIIAAIVGAVIVGMPLIPLEKLAPDIEARASSLLGREVRVKGELRLSALPSPRLRMTDVTLANWQQSDEQTMASVGELDLMIDLRALLSRKIHVQRLVIREPVITLERRGDQANWQLNPARANGIDDQDDMVGPTTSELPSESGFVLADARLRGIEIIGGSASFSPDPSQIYRFDAIKINAQMDGLNKPLSAAVSAKWQDHAIAFNGLVDALSDLLKGDAFSVEGQASLDDHRAEIGGIVSIHGSPRLSGMKMEAAGPNLAALMEIFSLSTPLSPSVLGAYSLSGLLDYSDQKIDLRGVSAQVGDAQISGDILVSLLGGFLMQTRQPIALKVGNLDQWVQALPSPPLASRPDLLTSLDLTGNVAIVGKRVEIFDSQLSLNDVNASGSAVVDIGGDQAFRLDSTGPIRVRVGDLNRWLQFLGGSRVPNDPEMFGAMSVEGSIAATPTSLSLSDTRVQLPDLDFQGSIDAMFDDQGFRFSSPRPLRLIVEDTNRWLDVLPNRRLPSSPQLFGPLRLAGQIAGDRNGLRFGDVQMALGNIQAAGSIMLQFGGQSGIAAQSQGPVRISGPSVDLIAQTFGIGLPRVNPAAYGAFQVSTELSYGAKRLSLTNLKAQMDQTSVAGQAQLDLNASPVAFAVNLSAGGIDTRPYFRLGKRDPAARKAVAQTDPNAPWGNAPISFGFLDKAQGSAVVRLEGLTTGMVDLGNTVAQLEWQNAALNANFQGTQLYDGEATGQVALTNRNGVSGLAANVNLTSVDAGKVLADLLGVDQLQGVTNLNLNVATQGGVLQDWMSGLNGRFTAQLNPLALIGLDLNASLANLNQGKFDAVSGPNHATQFREVGLSGTISNGVATIDDLSADLGDIGVFGSGKINLARQQLDYKFELLFNKKVPIPLIVRGSWLKPEILIDSTRIAEFALNNPQLFLDLLPEEWDLRGILPEGFSLVNIEQQAADAIAQQQAVIQAEAARIEAAARQEAQRLAQQAAAQLEAETQRLARQAQAEADRIAQQLADQAAAAARAQAQQFANQIGGDAGQFLQGAVDQSIQALGTQQGQDALGNFLGGLLGN